tara:strand:+ start:3383 stop:3775 length:393 start_codon:yes stop_codon:yes gene_type:complete
MAKLSVDIAKKYDLTVRRNDSFYLKVVLSNEDGTAYNITSQAGVAYQADFKIYNSNDEVILGFSSASGQNSPIIDSSISVTKETATLVISTTANNMGIYTGSYKYKLVVSESTDNETNTVMVGKFKIIDI